MTKRETASLCFKVMSLYAIIQATAKVSPLIFYIFTTDLSDVDIFSIISWFIEPISWIVCGLILWLSASLLAICIFKSVDHESISSTSIESVQSTAFSLAGLYLIVSVVPEFLKSATIHIAMIKYSIHGESPLLGTMIISAVQVIFGLWLLLGSQGLVNFIRATRHD